MEDARTKLHGQLDADICDSLSDLLYADNTLLLGATASDLVFS